MSKVVSFILVLVLFFAPVVNSFASEASEPGEDEHRAVETLMIIGGGILGVLLVVWLFGELFTGGHLFSEAPDNGIRMVSTENETSNVKPDIRPVLNVLQHIETGVTPNKDFYLGFRFQY